LRQHPGFTLAAVLTLALGIGATTAVYTVVHAVILDPVPGAQADRLVAIHEFNRERQWESGLSATLIHDLRERRDLFEEVCALGIVNAELATAGFSERLRGFRVSSGFFDLFEARPVLGRSFAPSDFAAATDSPMIISHGWWQRQFGGDPAVIGRTVRFETGTERYSIIGVMSPAFRFPNHGDLGQFWIPTVVRETARGPGPPRLHGNWQTIARLAPGVTLTTAQAALTTHAEALAKEYPGTNGQWSIQIRPLQSLFSTGELRRIYLGLMAAVAGVLLIAGINVANLLLARAETRRQEFAVRLALGATRPQLVRPILTECLLLSLVAGVLGLLIARWGIDSLQVFLHEATPRLREMGMDLGVYSFAVALAVVTGLVFGLAPAWQATRSQVGEALLSSGKGTPVPARRWLAQSLVVAEISLAMVVLVGAGLMLASVDRILAIDPGFDSRNLIMVRLGTPGARTWDRAASNAYYRGVGERFRSLPQVAAVGWVTPMSGHEYVGEGAHTPAALVSLRCSTGDFDYFQAIGAPLLAGRAFGVEDLGPAQRTVIVNQSLARLLWPGQSPTGRRFREASSEALPAWYEVIGVVGDIRDSGYEKPQPPTFYEPTSRFPVSFAFVQVRSTAGLEVLAPILRAELTGLADGIPNPYFHSMDERLRESSTARRRCMQLLGLFAAVGVLMAVIGIYGITSFSVASRTRELGIRQALGAGRGRIIGLVMGQGALLILTGLLLGVLAAHSLTRLLGSLLYDVSPTEPRVLLGTSLLFALVALAGCYLPARRAARTDPMEALRHE
jgi:putative ABC transport system permease protein